MKFLFILTIVVIAAVVYFYFFGNLNQSVNPFENKFSSSTAIYNNQAPSGKNSPGAGSSTPSGFKGPTGPPHIIGPSGPPPNY